MANRGHYMRINQIDRERIIQAFEANQDFISLGRQLNIHVSTVRSIIKRYQDTGDRNPGAKGGATYFKLSDNMINSLVRYVEAHPAITLKEMKDKLSVDHPAMPGVCVQTISKSLDGQLITLKKLQSNPIDWNTDEVKEARRDYMQWLVNEGMQENFVFQDETGFNLWTARTRGWAHIGQPAVRVINGQRGRNLSVSLAISPIHGLVHYKISQGFNREQYQGFITELSQLLADEQFILLIDNAPCHSEAEIGLQYDAHAIRRLPKYSPFLNPTELANSALKAEVKRRLSLPEIQQHLNDRNAAAALDQNLYIFRMQVLKQIVEDSLPIITQHKCHQWFQHSLRYTQRCLNLENILD